jgi:hypothetical protein
MLAELAGASLDQTGMVRVYEEDVGMAGDKARLPPRWFIKTFWHIASTDRARERGAQGAVASAPG